MERIEDLESAFRFLRPLCVLVTQNHDTESVRAMSEVLSGDKINEDYLDKLQEYIAFPLRLVLKQFAARYETSYSSI